MSRGVEFLWYPEQPESWGRKVALAPLQLAEWGFQAAVGIRNGLYDRGTLKATRVDGLRVISIGNVTVGGTGKTPVVIALAQRLTAAGRRVAVLSRGYGRRSNEVLSFDSRALPSSEQAGDEPLLIASKCPGVTVWVGPDRADLAGRAKDAGAELALLDDGLQHRRLARDLDIVVVDGASGLGNGHLIPRGPLREPPSAFARASLIWLRVPETAPVPLPSGVPIVRARHLPATVLAPNGDSLGLSSLRGQRVLALAAIARPERFVRTLQSVGAEVVAEVLLRDHAAFSPEVLARARSLAEQAGAWVITTEKDRTRLPAAFSAHVLGLEVEVLEGEGLLAELLGRS